MPIQTKYVILGWLAGNLIYNAMTHLFTINVAPGNSGTATLGLSLAPAPVIQIAPGTTGNGQYVATIAITNSMMFYRLIAL